jgi:hypothetical protein
MAAVLKWKALPPWAKHVRWLAVVLTSAPWVVFQVAELLPKVLLPLVLFGYLIVGIQALLPQTVEVGEDGVMLRSLGRRRFIRFDRIAAVTKNEVGVNLRLHGGSDVELLLSQKEKADPKRVDALHTAIENARTDYALLTRAEEEALLVRGSRDLETWTKDMRALGEGGRSGYRAIAIPEERLWNVVENASADPSAREGAAIALHARLDDEGRDRLRVAAGGIAAPRLRIALTTIAETAEPERIRVALDAIAEPEDTEEAEERRAEKR